MPPAYLPLAAKSRPCGEEWAVLTEEVGWRARRRGHGRVARNTDVKRPHSVSFLLPASDPSPVSCLFRPPARAASPRLPQTPKAAFPLLAYRSFDSPAGQHKFVRTLTIVFMCVNSPKCEPRCLLFSTLMHKCNIAGEDSAHAREAAVGSSEPARLESSSGFALICGGRVLLSGYEALSVLRQGASRCPCCPCH